MLKANEHHLHSQIQSMQSRLEALEKAYTGEYSKANQLFSRNEYHNEYSLENRYLGPSFGGSKLATMLKISYKNGDKYKIKVLEGSGGSEKLVDKPETDARGAIDIVNVFLSSAR